jgi:hypothetical protein
MHECEGSTCGINTLVVFTQLQVVMHHQRKFARAYFKPSKHLERHTRANNADILMHIRGPISLQEDLGFLGFISEKLRYFSHNALYPESLVKS